MIGAIFWLMIVSKIARLWLLQPPGLDALIAVAVIAFAAAVGWLLMPRKR